MAVPRRLIRLTGKQKAAALLIALGPELSAHILKQLKEEDIERLTWEIFNIGQLTPASRDQVMEEFYATAVAQEYAVFGGIEYAQEMLERALGKQKAQELITRLALSSRSVPFSFIRELDPGQLISFLQNE